MIFKHWSGQARVPDDLTPEELAQVDNDLSGMAEQRMARSAALAPLNRLAMDMTAPVQQARPVSVAAAGAMSAEQLNALQGRRQQQVQFDQNLQAQEREGERRYQQMTNLERMRMAQQEKRYAQQAAIQQQAVEAKANAPKVGTLGDFVYRLDKEGKMQQWRVAPEKMINSNGYIYYRDPEDPSKLSLVETTPEAAIKQGYLQAQTEATKAREMASYASAGASGASAEASHARALESQARLGQLGVAMQKQQLELDYQREHGEKMGTTSTAGSTAITPEEKAQLTELHTIGAELGKSRYWDPKEKANAIVRYNAYAEKFGVPPIPVTTVDEAGRIVQPAQGAVAVPTPGAAPAAQGAPVRKRYNPETGQTEIIQ